MGGRIFGRITRYLDIGPEFLDWRRSWPEVLLYRPIHQKRRCIVKYFAAPPIGFLFFFVRVLLLSRPF
jgi:hypothetical protein